MPSAAQRAGGAVPDQGLPGHAEHGGEGDEDYQRDSKAARELDTPFGGLGQNASCQVMIKIIMRFVQPEKVQTAVY